MEEGYINFQFCETIFVGHNDYNRGRISSLLDSFFRDPSPEGCLVLLANIGIWRNILWWWLLGSHGYWTLSAQPPGFIHFAFFFLCRVDKRPHFILTFYLSTYNTGRACGGPWVNIRSQSSSPFTVRVPAVELRSLGVVTSTFTSWAIFTRMRLHFDPGDVCISLEK